MCLYSYPVRSHTSCRWVKTEMVRMCLCGYPMKLHTNCGWAKVEMVGVCLCSYLTKSRTNCGSEKAEGWWGCVCAAIRWDYVRPAGGQRRRDGEDVFVQLSNKITHSLQIHKDSETVRMCLCSYPMGSRTSYRWVEIERWWGWAWYNPMTYHLWTEAAGMVMILSKVGTTRRWGINPTARVSENFNTADDKCAHCPTAR